jgi:hypothetical protein
MAPARASKTRPGQKFTPANSFPSTNITPASGITISLGRGIQQLSRAMARTIPARPSVTYIFVIKVVKVSVSCTNKKTLLRAPFAFDQY